MLYKLIFKNGNRIWLWKISSFKGLKRLEVDKYDRRSR